MFDDKKIMLVDESVFDFNPNDDEIRHRNATIVEFLRDAQSDFQIIVISDKPEQLRTQLNTTNLSERFAAAYQINQFPLLDDIREWRGINTPHVDVIISNRPLPEDPPDYDILKSIESPLGPDAYYYWYGVYDERVTYDAFDESIANICGMIEAHGKETQELLDRIYEQPDIFWERTLTLPEVQELTKVFSEVAAPYLGKTPEEKIKECLHGYFSYLVRKKHNVENEEQIDLNLKGYKEGIESQFKIDNIDDRYPREHNDANWLSSPLDVTHQNIADRALQAISAAVDAEPTKPRI